MYIICIYVCVNTYIYTHISRYMGIARCIYKYMYVYMRVCVYKVTRGAEAEVQNLSEAGYFSSCLLALRVYRYRYRYI